MQTACGACTVFKKEWVKQAEGYSAHYLFSLDPKPQQPDRNTCLFPALPPVQSVAFSAEWTEPMNAGASRDYIAGDGEGEIYHHVSPLKSVFCCRRQKGKWERDSKQETDPTTRCWLSGEDQVARNTGRGCQEPGASALQAQQTAFCRQAESCGAGSCPGPPSRSQVGPADTQRSAPSTEHGTAWMNFTYGATS